MKNNLKCIRLVGNVIAVSHIFANYFILLLLIATSLSISDHHLHNFIFWHTVETWLNHSFKLFSYYYILHCPILHLSLIFLQYCRFLDLIIWRSSKLSNHRIILSINSRHMLGQVINDFVFIQTARACSIRAKIYFRWLQFFCFIFSNLLAILISMLNVIIKINIRSTSRVYKSFSWSVRMSVSSSKRFVIYISLFTWYSSFTTYLHFFGTVNVYVHCGFLIPIEVRMFLISLNFMYSLQRISISFWCCHISNDLL